MSYIPETINLVYSTEELVDDTEVIPAFPCDAKYEKVSENEQISISEIKDCISKELKEKLKEEGIPPVYGSEYYLFVPYKEEWERPDSYKKFKVQD